MGRGLGNQTMHVHGLSAMARGDVGDAKSLGVAALDRPALLLPHDVHVLPQEDQVADEPGNRVSVRHGLPLLEPRVLTSCPRLIKLILVLLFEGLDDLVSALLWGEQFLLDSSHEGDQ